MTLNGGSTVFEANQARALAATIQGWCPGHPRGLDLLYRASRDGWTCQAFQDKSGHSSPTLTLVRVKAGSGDTCDSVVGGFSSVSWNAVLPGTYGNSPGAFLFMLKDGSGSGPDTFQPVKWGTKHGLASMVYVKKAVDPINIGALDLAIREVTCS